MDYNFDEFFSKYAEETEEVANAIYKLTKDDLCRLDIQTAEIRKKMLKESKIYG